MKLFKPASALVIGVVMIMGCISPELRTAKIAVKEQDWKRALNAVEAEIARDPGSAEAYYLKGYIYEELGNFPEMSAAFDKSLELSPQFADKIKAHRIRLVARYDKRYVDAYNKEEWETALTALDTAIIIDPNFPELYLRATMVAFYGKFFDRALELARQAIAHEPQDQPEIAPRRILISIYQERKDWKNVIVWAKSLMELVDPTQDDEGVYLTSIGALVGAYEELGDRKNAEKVIADAVATYPDNIELKMNLAYFMVNREDFDGAAKIYADVLSLDPDNLTANLNLGKIFFNKEQYQAAIPYFEKALEIEADNADALSLLASAYFNTHQDEKGYELLEKLKGLQGE